MAQKIIQTAGSQQLGDFAPEFAHLNDDILFGEVWSHNNLCRCETEASSQSQPLYRRESPTIL